ncbi:MAG: hypothetical protein ABI813_02050 [Bacteroidota bacterium]
MQMPIPGKQSVKIYILVYCFFLLVSFLLFLPVLDKGFASDDFLVLYRIVYQKIFFIRDFFRPLSDISLYGSYLTGGLNPVYYNVFNVLIHGSSAFLLYRICLLPVFAPVGNRLFFAWLAALLFLVYPFHNEAVIWAIGRGIVLSGFFGLLSLLVVFLDISHLKKCVLSGLFYFIGLCGYETILPLPLIILLLLYSRRGGSNRKLVPLAGGYLLALLTNIILHAAIAGAVWGPYGSKMFSSSVAGICIKFFKTAGRLFLPPSQSSGLLVGFFIIMLLGIAWYAGCIIKKKDSRSQGFVRMTVITFVSCIIPALFGISTRTYEGDRVFYFSSFFLCIWIAYLVALLKGPRLRRTVTGLVGFYFLFFFYESVFIWRISGQMASAVIRSVAAVKQPGKKLYLINIPEEYKGAQVMRNGFAEALLMHRIDTGGIVAINYLSSDSAAAVKGAIKPENRPQGIFIYPAAIVRSHSIDARVRTGINFTDSVHVALNGTDLVYYWDKESLVLFRPSF